MENQNIPQEKMGVAIVEAMLALAYSLDIDTIAEVMEIWEELEC